MKKNYVTPESEIITFSSRDVITLSVEKEGNGGNGVHLGDYITGASMDD